MHEKHRSLSTTLRDSHSSTWKPKRERQIIYATVSWGIKFISTYSNSDNQRKLRVAMAGGGGTVQGVHLKIIHKRLKRQMFPEAHTCLLKVEVSSDLLGQGLLLGHIEAFPLCSPVGLAKGSHRTFGTTPVFAQVMHQAPLLKGRKRCERGHWGTAAQ